MRSSHPVARRRRRPGRGWFVTRLVGLACVLVGVLGSTPATSAAAAPAPANPAPRQTDAAWLRAELTGLAADHQVSGTVCAEVTTHTAELSRACVATNGVAPAQEPVFRIGSVTKLLTAVAVAQLAERGRLSLDVDVARYLDFPIDEHLGTVTLRQLLDSTAGYEEHLADADRSTASGLVELRRYLSSHPPRQVWRPGTMPAYSNWSADLAGYIVQRVSGQPFEQYLREQVFGPLGMTSSTLAQPLPAGLDGRLPASTTTIGSRVVPFEYVNDRPAGGATSSASDMGRFLRFLLGTTDPAVLSSAGRAGLVSGAPEAGLGALSRAGYIAMAMEHYQYRGEPVSGHDGETLGWTSNLAMFPRAGLGVFVAANSRHGASALEQQLVCDVADHWLHPAARPVTATTPGAAERAAAVAGHWESTRRSVSTPLAFVVRQESTVTARDDGSIELDGQLLHEVSPWVWADPDRREVVAARVVDGRVGAISTWPTVTLTRAPALATPRRAALVVAGVAGSLLVLVFLGVVALVRAARHRDGTRSETPAREHRLAGSHGRPVALTAWLRHSDPAPAPTATVLSAAGFATCAPWSGQGLDLVVRTPLLRLGQLFLVLSLVAAVGQLAVAAGCLRRRQWRRAGLLVAGALPSLDAGLVGAACGLLRPGLGF